MRECFDSLDDDGSGDIGVDELKEPLIGLGFA
jgi:Ca2+-binding EF-hand superfamily protein